MRESSLHSLKERLHRYPHLRDLEAFLTRVKQEAPVAIILYGSLARGDYTQRSDIDVLCVFDREFADPRERFMLSYKHSDGIVQPKTVSLTEFKNGLLQGDAFLHGIIEDGVWLQGTIPVSIIHSWVDLGRENISVAPFHP